MKKNYRFHYLLGTTTRINVCMVCDDKIGYQADSPERLENYWKDIIAEQPDHEPDKEQVVVVLLNTRLRAYAWNRVSLGTNSESHVHPREVFRPAIVGAAHAIVLMHNHPSGDPSPSSADERITRTLVEAGKLLKIRFLDHVIIGSPSPGRNSYFSFLEIGLVP